MSSATKPPIGSTGGSMSDSIGLIKWANAKFSYKQTDKNRSNLEARRGELKKPDSSNRLKDLSTGIRRFNWENPYPFGRTNALYFLRFRLLPNPPCSSL